MASQVGLVCFVIIILGLTEVELFRCYVCNDCKQETNTTQLKTCPAMETPMCTRAIVDKEPTLSCCLQAMVDGKSMKERSRELSPEEQKQFKVFAKNAFNGFDADKDGQIDEKETHQLAREYYKGKFDEASIKKASAEFIRLADKNGDTKLNFDEFYQYLLLSYNLTE